MHEPVFAIMARDVVCVDTTDHLVAIENESIVGVVTSLDIVKQYLLRENVREEPADERRGNAALKSGSNPAPAAPTAMVPNGDSPRSGPAREWPTALQGRPCVDSVAASLSMCANAQIRSGVDAIVYVSRVLASGSCAACHKPATETITRFDKKHRAEPAPS